jgi:hypothetical protein
MPQMRALTYARDQLSVASQDWSNHCNLMEGLDAEIAELNQRIRTLLGIRGYLSQLDGICIKRMTNGQMGADEELFQLWQEVIAKLGESARWMLGLANEFVVKGIPIPEVTQLRHLSENPGRDLEMADVIRELDSVSKEQVFDDRAMERLAAEGRAFRHLD